MTPGEREEIEKVANSLVQHIDEMGMNHIRGYKVLMITETILTQVEKARDEALEEAAKLAEDCPHVGEPCCYCGQKIASAIRNKLNQKGE